MAKKIIAITGSYRKGGIVERTVEAILHWSEAMRLNYEFALHGVDGTLRATGASVHLLVDKGLNLQMTAPDFYREFLDRWRDGEIAVP